MSSPLCKSLTQAILTNMGLSYWGLIVDGDLVQVFKTKDQALRAAGKLKKYQDMYSIIIARFLQSETCIRIA